MLIEELGEFGLIERIRQRSRLRSFSSFDDAAIIPITKERFLLVTTDMLVENVHFCPILITPYQIGWRAMASNLSDIAAMGGLPTHFLVSLCIRPHTRVDFIDELYRGMEDLGIQFDLNMLGGDTNHGESLIVSITLLGEVERENLVRRDGARDGDTIMITGSIGEAQCGLHILKKGHKGSDEMIRRHTTPIPRVVEARALVTNCKITAMIDLSDGLASDLYHIIEASGVGARIYLDRLPISSILKDEARALGLDPVELALYGGEDYELLFTTREPALVPNIGIPITIIGEIIKDKGIFLVDDGKEKGLYPRGYRHF